mmetsp:Transcript_11796/g.18105  ORF Transcript_11796/g.18105 Transcript_11796/m.18105 type:complete len:142 (+) Transcript_11796:641-1066(+)
MSNIFGIGRKNASKQLKLSDPSSSGLIKKAVTGWNTWQSEPARIVKDIKFDCERNMMYVLSYNVEGYECDIPDNSLITRVQLGRSQVEVYDLGLLGNECKLLTKITQKQLLWSINKQAGADYMALYQRGKDEIRAGSVKSI